MPGNHSSELSIATTADNNCSDSANCAGQSEQRDAAAATTGNKTLAETAAATSAQTAPSLPDSDSKTTDTAESQSSKEIGGREGLDPVRYGDWEKGGRCIDF